MKKYMKDSVDPNKTIITKTPLDRLDYRGDLGPVVERLAEAYGIGTPAEYSVIERGYEDLVAADNSKAQVSLTWDFAAMFGSFSMGASWEQTHDYDAVMGNY